MPTGHFLRCIWDGVWEEGVISLKVRWTLISKLPECDFSRVCENPCVSPQMRCYLSRGVAFSLNTTRNATIDIVQASTTQHLHTERSEHVSVCSRMSFHGISVVCVVNKTNRPFLDNCDAAFRLLGVIWQTQFEKFNPMIFERRQSVDWMKETRGAMPVFWLENRTRTTRVCDTSPFYPA